MADPRVEKYLSQSQEHGLGVSLGFEREGPEKRPVYAAWLTEFPGCISQGQTETEAVERLLALAPKFLETILELGVELPNKPPALAIGYVQFYDPQLGSDRSISEPGRVKESRPSVTSPSPEAQLKIEKQFATSI